MAELSFITEYLDVRLLVGASLAFDLAPKADSGEEFDMTDRTVESVIYDRYDAAIMPAVLEFTSDVTSNTINLSLTSAQTTALGEGLLAFMVWAVSDDERIPLGRGTLELVAP